MGTAKPYAAEAGGLRLAVRLTPRANRHGLDGVTVGADGRPVLQIRLAAPPVEGAANKALLTYLAEALGVRKTALAIRSGEAARFKILFIEGDGPALIARLEDWIARTGG